MEHINDIIYCLACRQPMPASEATCPSCGANQAEARAQRMQTTPAARKSGGPTAVAPRTETVPCPTCHVPVQPSETRCHYCGHMMDDPGAQRRYEVGYSKVFVGIGTVFLLLGFFLCFFSFYWMFCLMAVAMGYMAMSEDRYNGAAGRLVWGGFIALAFGFALRWFLLAYLAEKAVSAVH